MHPTIESISQLIQTGTVSDIKDGLDTVGLQHVNTDDAGGYTLLQQAATYGKAAIATYLVAHGAKINPANSYPDATFLAAQNGHQDLADYLMIAKNAQDCPAANKRGARFGRTP